MKRYRNARMVWAVSAALLVASAGAQAVKPHMVEASDGIQQQIRVSTGKTVSIKSVSVDIRDPLIQVEPVTAASGIGYDEPFDSFIARTGAVAAVNGTFFNAYEKGTDVRFPNGLMMAEGRVLHSGENQSFYVSSDKQAGISQVDLGVRVTFRSGRSTSTYFPWGVNKYYGDAETDQVVWYTPDMGREIAWPGGTRIVIRENQVTEITRSAVSVPGDGAVLFVGDSDNNRTNLLPRVHVGDAVESATVVRDLASGEELDATAWVTALGVGPKLVTDGEVDVDFKRDGFDDPKITTQSNRRSFIGVDRNGLLVMGTMESATVREEAEAAKAMGLVQAMNLDGGSSSALYGGGRVLTAPGRKLSNVLVVRRLPEAQVQIAINGRFIPDFKGFLRHNTSMVPIRPLMVAMGADWTWDGPASTLTVRKAGQTLVVRVGDRSVKWNGQERTLEEPPVIVDGHVVLPLRFMIEIYGGKVEWNPSLYRASLQID